MLPNYKRLSLRAQRAWQSRFEIASSLLLLTMTNCNVGNDEHRAYSSAQGIVLYRILIPFFHLEGGGLHCIDDLLITSAAAEVAADAFSDFSSSRVWIPS